MLKHKMCIDKEVLKLDTAWYVKDKTGPSFIGIVSDVAEDRVVFAGYVNSMGRVTRPVTADGLQAGEVEVYGIKVDDVPLIPPADGSYDDIMKLRGEAFSYAIDNQMPIGDTLLSRETMRAVIMAYEKRGK